MANEPMSTSSDNEPQKVVTLEKHCFSCPPPSGGHEERLAVQKGEGQEEVSPLGRSRVAQQEAVRETRL